MFYAWIKATEPHKKKPMKIKYYDLLGHDMGFLREVQGLGIGNLKYQKTCFMVQKSQKSVIIKSSDQLGHDMKLLRKVQGSGIDNLENHLAYFMLSKTLFSNSLHLKVIQSKVHIAKFTFTIFNYVFQGHIFLQVSVRRHK